MSSGSIRAVGFLDAAVYVLQTSGVRVISKPAVLRFSERHADALVPLMNWYRITGRADWVSLAEMRRDFAHADLVGRSTVFNIHGNHYSVFILHILTHVEDSKGDWKR